jgi:hypothetical protein
MKKKAAAAAATSDLSKRLMDRRWTSLGGRRQRMLMTRADAKARLTVASDKGAARANKAVAEAQAAAARDFLYVDMTLALGGRIAPRRRMAVSLAKGQRHPIPMIVTAGGIYAGSCGRWT